MIRDTSKALRTRWTGLCRSISPREQNILVVICNDAHLAKLSAGQKHLRAPAITDWRGQVCPADKKKSYLPSAYSVSKLHINLPYLALYLYPFVDQCSLVHLCTHSPPVDMACPVQRRMTTMRWNSLSGATTASVFLETSRSTTSSSVTSWNKETVAPESIG